MQGVSARAIPKIDLPTHPDLEKFLPEELRRLGDLQGAIPESCKEPEYLTQIEREAVEGDSDQARPYKRRRREGCKKNMVGKVAPYVDISALLDSEEISGQLLGKSATSSITMTSSNELDRVWRRCFDSLVVPGGRLVCVVGDVCLSRRKNDGRHTVVPLHATIQDHCRKIGFDNLSPIIWHKIANAAYEVENGGGGFLRKALRTECSHQERYRVHSDAAKARRLQNSPK